MKSLAKSIPVIGPFLVRLRNPPQPAQAVTFTNSSEYWEQRYRAGGNSGAGSYNRLAEFKAAFLNEFVERNRIQSVIEWGCGDGAQLRLARYPEYLGVDVATKAVEMCRGIFSGDASKRFITPGAVSPDVAADLALSLDVIYHLVEDPVFAAYMESLFNSGRRFVIVYASNVDQDWPARHVRHRQFTKWVAEHRPDWRLESVVKNIYPYDPENPEQTSFADFFVFAKG